MKTASVGEADARALDDLLAGLRLERSGDDSFLAPVVTRNLPRVFGGQILAQGLCAAYEGLPSDRRVHSFHAYFVHPGDPTSSIGFTVERVKDSASFSVRAITAHQSDRAIFTMLASFHVAESGFEHAEEVEPAHPSDVAAAIDGWPPADGIQLPGWWTTRGPLDVIFASRPVGLVGGDPRPARLRLWLRPADRRALTSTEALALLAYGSDLSLLDVALQPLGVSWFGEPPVRGASLDHAMWIHRPVDWRDWLQFDIACVISREGRPLVRAEVREASGDLVATVMQEGLLRTPRHSYSQHASNQ